MCVRVTHLKRSVCVCHFTASEYTSIQELALTAPPPPSLYPCPPPSVKPRPRSLNPDYCSPQVPIYSLLSRFDGATISDDIRAGRRRFRLTRLPNFLALQVKRFKKNNFFIEKNPTLVTFPVRALDLADAVPVPQGACCWRRAAQCSCKRLCCCLQPSLDSFTPLLPLPSCDHRT